MDWKKLHPRTALSAAPEPLVLEGADTGETVDILDLSGSVTLSGSHFSESQLPWITGNDDTYPKGLL